MVSDARSLVSVATSLTEALTATRDLSFGTSLTTAKISSSSSACPAMAAPMTNASRTATPHKPLHDRPCLILLQRVRCGSPIGGDGYRTGPGPLWIERLAPGGFAGIGDRKGSLAFEVHNGTAIRTNSPAPIGNGRKRLIVCRRTHRSQYANRVKPFQGRDQGRDEISPNACFARGK